MLRTSLTKEDGVYRFDDGSFEWYLPNPDYNKFTTCKQWDTIHDRYQGRLDTGDTLLKVGAASGEDLPLAATNVGPTGRIYAFEPDPENFNCLNKNLELHDVTTATTEMVAVSDTADEEVTFLKNRDSHTTHRLSDAVLGSDEGYSEITVPTTTVDEICAKYDIDRLKMLSITVNRHEAAVLAGATETLQHTQYVVIPYSDVELGDAPKLLEDAGFQLVDDGGGSTGCLYETTR